jgi:acetylcholinesterase
MTDYLVRFATNLDPNGNTGINWPRYDASGSRELLTFLDGPVPLNLTADTFRLTAMNEVTKLSLEHPFD